MLLQSDLIQIQKDLSNLDFVAIHADIERLQQELQKRLGDNAPRPAIVAKIETAIAISKLPDLIIHAAGKQSFGVMIVRGDLAVEIRYQRWPKFRKKFSGSVKWPM